MLLFCISKLSYWRNITLKYIYIIFQSGSFPQTFYLFDRGHYTPHQEIHFLFLTYHKTTLRLIKFSRHLVKNITMSHLQILKCCLKCWMLICLSGVCRNQNADIYSGEFAGFMSRLSLFWGLQEVNHAAWWNTRRITKRCSLENISDPIWIVQ